MIALILKSIEAHQLPSRTALSEFSVMMGEVIIDTFTSNQGSGGGGRRAIQAHVIAATVWETIPWMHTW